jgi:hypothetical protein
MGVVFLSNLDAVAQHLATGSRQVNVAYVVEEDALCVGQLQSRIDFGAEVGLVAFDEVAPVFGVVIGK